MLQSQLEHIKQSRTTQPHNKKKRVAFVSEENDSYTLISLIKPHTEFINVGSLHFERQNLSSVEETRFNRKFVPYIRSLMAHMDDPDIDYTLELLVRIYFADAFNKRELFHLLLPFPKYFKQIQILGELIHGASSFQMENYSTNFITRYLMSSSLLFFEFVRYFEYFDGNGDLARFLDSVLECISVRSKGMEFKYHSEIYRIMELLIQKGHPSKALRLFHSMYSHLNSQDFRSLLADHFSENEISLEKRQETRKPDKFILAFEKSAGRAFLKDEPELAGYLEMLEQNNLNCSEFSSEERELLLCWKNKTEMPELCSIHPYMKLYNELRNRKWLIELFLKCKNLCASDLVALYESMSIEEKILLIQQSINSDYLTRLMFETLESLLTDENHFILVKNITKRIFNENYTRLLEVCSGFSSFALNLFDRYEEIKWNRGIQAHNRILLAEHHSHDISMKLFEGFKQFLEGSASESAIDSNYVRYLAANGKITNVEQARIILEALKRKPSAALSSELAQFFIHSCECEEMGKLADEMCLWASGVGLADSASLLVPRRASHLSDDLLWYFVKSGVANKSVMVCAVNELNSRGFPVVPSLFEMQNFAALFDIYISFGLSFLLVDDPNVVKFIEKYFNVFLSADQDLLIRFILSNLHNQEYLKFIPLIESELVKFRDHEIWKDIRPIVEQWIDSVWKAQNTLDYVVEHITQFIDDVPLFDAIFALGINLSLEQIKFIAKHACAPAADLADSALRHDCPNLVPALPFLSPLLIAHAKDSIRILFERYGPLMGIYSSEILSQFPSAADLLYHCDSRYSLSALMKKRFSLLDSRELDLVLRILQNLRCSSFSVVENMSAWLLDDITSSNFNIAVFLAFINFYINSHGNRDSSSLSNLIYTIFSNSVLYNQVNPDKWNEREVLLVSDAISVNSSIFISTFNFLINQMQSGRLVGSVIFREYFKRASNLDTSPALNLEIAKMAIMFLPSTVSLISAICTRIPAIVPEINRFILQQIEHCKDEQKISNFLSLLDELFKEVREYRVCKNDTIEMSAILSELANEHISNKAQQLYETIQLLPDTINE